MTDESRTRGGERRWAGRPAGFWLPWLVAIFGCAVSFWLWRAMLGQQDMAIEARFQRDAAAREAVVEERVKDALNALRVAAALFDAAGEVEGGQFSRMARPILAAHPFLQALGWNPVVERADRESFESAARAAGSEDYEITERSETGAVVRAGDRARYVAVRFIEPYPGNEVALGFDVASEPRRRAALERAGESGELAVTEAITLVQDRDQEAGLLAFVPVHRAAEPPGEGRQVRGFVVGVLRAEQLVEGALAAFEPRGIWLSVVDETAPPEARRLYPANGALTGPRDSVLQRSKTLDVGGRRWRIELMADPSFAAGHRTIAPLRTLLVGLLLTLLAAAGSALLVGRSRRDERLVAERTEALRAANRALEEEIARRGAVERELSTYRDQLEELVTERTTALEATAHDLRRALAQQEAAEAALAESEERLRLTLGAAADGAWDWNLETGEVYFSDGWLESLGYERDEIEGTTAFWESITHPEDLPEIRRRIGLHLKGVSPSYECENRLRTRSGEYRWNLNRGLVVARDADGRALRMVGTDTDISARRAAEERQLRAERQTQQAQKLASLGVLAGGIAHDFNNLLVAILGGADLALQTLPRAAPAREPLEEVRAAAGRAAELVRQIHAFSGQASLARERVDLSRLVAGMEDELRAAVAKNVRLRFDVGGPLPVVEADETQIRQVVSALVHNASEALAGRSGEVLVRTDRFAGGAPGAETLPPGDCVVLTVTDDGCGIDEDVLSRMFDPFFSTKERGQGLGLAATQGIVRSHGGEVLVDSTPGRGTTMRVVLPVAGTAQGPSATDGAREAEAWRGSGTVLVVDDDAAVRTIAERMLRLLGFDVLTAANGAAGVEAFREHRDDIVLTLMDINMPHMDGAEAFRRLRGVEPTARVLFSSGDSERATAGATADDPFAGFIQKPYRIAELRAKLQAALGARP